MGLLENLLGGGGQNQQDLQGFVNRPATVDIDESANETVKVPLTEETVDVETRPVVTEKVNVRKTAVTESQRVTDTVRKEQAEIQTSQPARLRAHEHNYVDDRCAICGAPRSEHPA